jgi:hypothetical protein
MSSELKYLGTNIYTAPNGLHRRTVRHGHTSLVKELYAHAQTVCRDQISDQYIADVLNPDKKNFSRGFAYFIDDEIIGFVVWSIKNYDKLNAGRIHMSSRNIVTGPSKSLFIDLICAKQTGTTLGYTMLNDVENYCIDNAIPFMKLRPADDELIPYYEKYGFTLTSNEYGNIMSKGMVKLIDKMPSNYKSGKTRKAGRIRPQISERDRLAIQKYLRDADKLSQNIKQMNLFIKNLS